MKDKIDLVMKEGVVKAGLIDDSLIHFVIPKQEIDNRDTYRILNQLSEFRKAGTKGKNALMFEFNGYNNDPREVYDVPEIQAYMRIVFKEYPELFYYLCIGTYTFAIAANCIFTKLEEIRAADQASVEFGENSGDEETIITVGYYMHHREKFHKG